MGIETAILGAAVLGAGASMASSRSQSKAAGQAADASAESAKYSADIQKQMYDQQRADMEPWRVTGQNALARLIVNSGLYPGDAGPGGEYGMFTKKFGMEDFEADPGYQFRLAEGEKAINRAAAARGGYDSGGTLKALNRYGQGMASDEYQNAFNRWNAQNNQIFNRFASIAGVGQTANQQLGSAGQNYANQVGTISQNNAANQGNALLAGSNARASGYTGFGNALASGLNAWSMQRPAYSLGTGTYGNAWSGMNGYEPLDYGTYNSMGGFYD